MRFDQLNLSPAILANVAAEGYEIATPIQAGAIPLVLGGRDVLGSAQTGTGKTAAFALPIIHRLTAKGSGTGDQGSGETPTVPKKRKPSSSPTPTPNPDPRSPRCLILCPTRELATQISDAFKVYASGSGLRGVTIYGGVNQNPQTNKLQRGVDVIIATPGRLMDLMNQGYVDLSGVETLVLDEADRMLDMGFINDIRRITAELPDKRQTLMFSATLPSSILSLADRLLTNPATVQIEAAAPTADLVEQSVYFVDTKSKSDLLADLIAEQGMFRTIVFTRTKHGADKLVKKLRLREIKSEAIHGNKTQNARQRALDNFRGDRVAVLVATDVAARGIDVDNVSHVVNFDLTHEPETYVHRIGRTARAGQAGVAISFCDVEELGWLRDIERLLGKEITVANEKPDWANRPARSPKPQGGRGGRGNFGGGGGFKKSHRKGNAFGGAAAAQGSRGGTRVRPQRRRRRPDGV